MSRRITTAVVMAALWPALKLLEVWAGHVERQNRKRETR